MNFFFFAWFIFGVFIAISSLRDSLNFLESFIVLMVWIAIGLFQERIENRHVN